jgi:hypothetical protein
LSLEKEHSLPAGGMALNLAPIVCYKGVSVLDPAAGHDRSRSDPRVGSRLERRGYRPVSPGEDGVPTIQGAP